MSFQSVRQFEDAIAKFFGAPYGVAVDSCTHAIELCLRYQKVKKITIPNRTYLSIAFLGSKLGIEWDWKNENWQDYYYLGETNIVDAAVLWRRNSYIPNTMMCISFQYQKHLNIGRGGMVLIDNEKDKDKLKKMSYDGRIPDVPWREQNIDQIGYHYYMTPETAELGLTKLPEAIKKKPRKWVITDWPDLSKMEIFK
jgi:dTDP-4-amino-4,6-dideoxygalactose transaminase